jgi:purine-nucleoside/S-methyl-5'-thioadenosine phosphorylase / adenosine deaminase
MLSKFIADKGVAGIEVLRVKAWEQYGWLRHGFSTRTGGVSPVYGEHTLNLGWTREDDPALVAENRRRFVVAAAGEMAGKADFTLVNVRQIHSGITLAIREEDGPLAGKLQTPEGKAVLEGDGLMTNLPGVMLGVGTADCVPVLVADVKKRVVAAFHAGWRGTVARIVEQGIAQMTQEYGSQPQDLIAAIGPSIGACCYAVGEELRTAFSSQFDYADDLFLSDPKANSSIHVDLWKANHRQLLVAGVEPSRITVIGECAACSRDEQGRRRYFSHRAEHGVAGRMLNVVGVVPE